MNTGPEYQGMRWFKCDLHMHTPADSKHWRGAPLGDSAYYAAENYIRRCYEIGLEVIGITDHNFSSRSFILNLKGAISRLSLEYGYQIVLFPGFEINADVGRGMHVLALFEPGADVEEIDHVLTNCGVPMPRQRPDGTYQPSTKRLPEIIEEVQKRDANGHFKGVVICPHPHETGIFDSDRISEWLQQHEWKQPGLLAVEVPKPIHDMSSGWRCLFRNDEDCRADWKRPRPIAGLMSSDAKAYRPDEDMENYIGKRFSWIKMSRPSIESLRQAFLDPESRIFLGSNLPKVVHTHVKTVRVSGNKFLHDQVLEFSPHLHCIIGGRGSGKSLLFESIRLGLRGDMSFSDVDERDDVAARQIKRLRGTFQMNTGIKLCVYHDELEDQFIVDDSGQPARIEGREVDDPPTVFRRLNALIFSQEQITQLAERQKNLLQLIDNIAADRLEPHRARARATCDRLKTARQMDAMIARLESEANILKQEAAELGRQLEAKTQVQEELRKHRAAQDAQRYLGSLSTKAQNIEGRLKDLAEELDVEPPPIGSRLDTYPKKEFFGQVEEKIGAAYHRLADALRKAVETFRESVDLVLTKHQDWATVQDAIREAEETFETACSQKGLTPEEAEKLRETEQQHRIKQAAFQAKQSDLESARKQKPDCEVLLRELTQCWTEETYQRRVILDKVVASETMPRTRNGEPILKVSLSYAGDRNTFLGLWGNLAPDRRTATGRAWDRYARDGVQVNIGDELFNAFQSSIGDPRSPMAFGNPVQWLEYYLNRPEHLPRVVREHMETIKRVREEKADEWFELLLTRIPDAADLVLLRSDGSEAGSFQKESLSTGQKNTAILSLLLARGNGPVLIDQPEDELDSEFLYRDLVPMFRKAKIQRQLIIVTHNANLPVNGDTELVYALEAKGGRGVCRTQGGLDRADVTRAVLDIMEGSEEAFRRRKEKYHF